MASPVGQIRFVRSARVCTRLIALIAECHTKLTRAEYGLHRVSPAVMHAIDLRSCSRLI